MYLATTRPQSQQTFLLLALLILLLGFTLRILNLTRLPLYFDEAHYISWTQDALEGHPFVGDLRKIAFYQFLSLFNPTGPEAVWITRAASAIFSVLTIASCVAIGKMLASRRVGLFAGLIYAVLPFAVFHERTVLAEPLQSAAVALSLVLMAQLSRRPHPARAVLLGTVLTAAYLIKVSSLFYLLLPAVVGLILSDQRRNAALMGMFSTVTAVGLILAIFLWVAHFYENAFLLMTLQPLTAASSGAAPGQWDMTIITRNLEDYVEMMQIYLKQGVVALLLISPLWLVIGREARAEILFLLFPGFVFVIPILLSRGADAQVMVPRYMLISVIALAVLCAISLEYVVRLFRNTRAGITPAITGLALICIVTPCLWFDMNLSRDPTSVKLYKSDRVNFVSGFLSGGGFPEMTDDLLTKWEQHPDTLIHVLGGNKAIIWVRAYMGSRVVDVDYIDRGSRSQRASVARWLGQGEPVYFLSGSTEDVIAEDIHGMQLEVIAEYNMNTYGTIYVLVAAGLKGVNADEVYNQRVATAEQMSGDYDRLNTAIQNSDVAQVIIFPTGHAAYLDTISDIEVTPLAIGAWPPSEGDQAAGMIAALPEGDRQHATLVLIDESHADPDRNVILTLHDYCYQTGDAWFGLQHLISCITGPNDPPLSVLNAWYEDVIALKQGAVLDPSVHAGEAVRVALIWETTTPVEDEWLIYAHVMDTATGTLQAQYDSIPGGGLLPMTSWRVGEEVRDHFGIALPAGLPPGKYEVRIGIYHPVNGARLPVTRGDDAGPDYIVVGHFAVVS
jgi:4-amino-4-deoxy-L-arabinose transferase-like glycosyltransferase